MLKKDVMKLKPGTFIEVEWNDSDNSVVMLLDKPDHRLGDISLRCLYPDGTYDSHIMHSQVVKTRGRLSWPE